VAYHTTKEQFMEELLTVKDVVKILKIHRKTVIEFINQGKIKAHMVGSQYRIKPSDLKTYIKNMEV
jgi:excisionase family DNA binding protein